MNGWANHIHVDIPAVDEPHRVVRPAHSIGVVVGRWNSNTLSRMNFLRLTSHREGWEGWELVHVSQVHVHFFFFAARHFVVLKMKISLYLPS